MAAAVFGLIGVALGGLLQLAAQHLAERTDRKAERARVRLLKEMLQDADHPWRDITTCSRVVGADRETTVRLLLVAGARASEAPGERELWGLISRNPFKR